ncbi:MotB family protein [Salinarimonas sp.]|uniref:MotB family protein n=1 Tax=Salinarimonas sp. TaxID=2766526 RepID=UPI0032D8B5D5
MDEQHHELVIIRRRPDPEADEPKTGVWKIAYADFMTAMMAFFLVMWLINATDQETREVVASYFNPIRLAEATTDRKGLRDPDQSSEGVDLEERSDAPVTEADEQIVTQAPVRLESERRYSETALFQDPYAVLSALAAQARFEPAPPAAGIDLRPGERGDPGLTGGDAYRDPFDPIYWQLAPQIAVGRSDGDGTGGPMGTPDAAAPFGMGGPSGGPAGPSEIELAIAERALAQAVAFSAEGAVALDGEARPLAGAEPGAGEAEVAETVVSPEAATELAEAAEAVADAPRPEPVAVAEEEADAPPPAAVAQAEDEPVFVAEAQRPEPEPAPQAAAIEAVDESEAAIAEAEPVEAPDPALARAAALRARIAAAMAEATGAPAAANVPAIEVAATAEGVLVSLTDDANFGMFAIGSAEPRPELVRVLEEIAPILAEEAGAIVIRGHTDARPFRSADYDNWRLSSARAHMAYYMLVRGGFAEERILRVEGHADRLLKVSADPYAAQNRRIEILLSPEEART